MDFHSSSEIREPSVCRMERCIGGRDLLVADTPTTGSFLQSPRVQRIDSGKLDGRSNGRGYGRGRRAPDAAMPTTTGDAKPLRCEGGATAAGHVVNQCEGREKKN